MSGGGSSSQHFQRAGELVGATGAAALAVDAAQAGDDVRLFHARAEGREALRVAVAAAGVLDAADDVALELDVDLLRADGAAGEEGGPADAALLNIRNWNYVEHIVAFAVGKDSENSPFFLVCILEAISKSLQTLQGFGAGGRVV